MEIVRVKFPYIILLLLCIINCGCDLVVNVKTRRGDISQEVIGANPEHNLVTLSYKLNDGQYIDMLIDIPKVGTVLIARDW